MAFVLVDDLTRIEITDPEHAPTVISVDGHAVENDLSAESRERLRELLAPYYAAGRMPGERVEPGAFRRVLDAVESGEIRAVHFPAGLPADEQPVAPDPTPNDSESASRRPHDADAPTVDLDVSDTVIRKWARQHGVDCPAREQVQASVKRLYVDSAGGPPRSGGSTS